MKQALINYIQNPKEDEFFTPPEAIIPMLQYIPKNWVVWECTDPGESNITKLLREHGCTVISSHIAQGESFFTTDKSCDLIMTNPPYSLKTEFLKRAYELSKRFAFLLPVTALEGVDRNKLYRKYGLELLVFDRRINYTKQKNVYFNTSWFCNNLLPEKLQFAEVIQS